MMKINEDDEKSRKKSKRDKEKINRERIQEEYYFQFKTKRSFVNLR